MKYRAEVLKRPVLTEKTVKLMDSDNVYTFDVDVKANKMEVKDAVEHIFNVEVEKVNIVNVRPKTKRMGRYVGKTNRRRKALVKLAPGQQIELY